MSMEQKLEILRAVEGSGLPAIQALRQLGIPRSTYYRWRRKSRHIGSAGLADRKPGRGRVWNQLLAEEVEAIREVAQIWPEWSSREIAFHITDHVGFSVGESTVYR